MPSKQFTATILLILAAFIWGTAFVAQSTGMEFIGPLTFTNIRFLIGAILIAPFALREKNLFLNIENQKKKKLYFILFYSLFYRLLIIIRVLFTTIRSSIYKNRKCCFLNYSVCPFCSDYFSFFS